MHKVIKNIYWWKSNKQTKIKYTPFQRATQQVFFSYLCRSNICSICCFAYIKKVFKFVTKT